MANQQISPRSATRALSARIDQIARAVISPAAQQDANLSSSATLNAQIWLGQFPWRPTAAWAVAAALLSLGLAPRLANLDWQTVVLLLLLVDPLWGSIWRLAAGRAEMLPLHKRVVAHRVWLPYMQAESPAAQLLGRNYAKALPLVFRVAMPSLLLATVIAVVLGKVALWMTATVALISILGWTSRRALQRTPALMHSVVTIGLPWALALYQVGDIATDANRTTLIVLVLLWTLHNWGEGRMLRTRGDWFGLALLASAEVGIVAVLLMARASLWLALLVVLCLPTWLLVVQRRPLQRANFWWLLAMLASAVALGQSLYI